MNKKVGWLLSIVLLFAIRAAFATTIWSTQDYDLYSGDFDGDGVADLLYIAKAPGNLSGIARGVSGGFDTSFQAWRSDYLGIAWSGNQYNVIILQNKSATNKQADILLQSKSAGGSSFLLKPDSNGRIQTIYESIGTNGGLTWSADQHALVAGDFNGDGLADMFLQSATVAGTSAVMLADANGQFTASSAAQPPWSDGFLGFKWATSEAIIYSGDFNGDGRDDLLIQARPKWVTIDFDVPFPVPAYPNMNGIAFAHATGSLFSSSAAVGEALGYYAWSRNAFGVDWSPLVTNLTVGHFNGSAYSDILLQALHSNHTSYLATANGSSSVFANGTALASNLNWSADTVRLIAGKYSSAATTGIYFQALTRAGTNSFATNVTGSTVTTTTQDPSAPPPVPHPTVAGRTPTTFSVANDGTVNYTIPISLPPALGALDLKLSLVYSSRGSNGTLGMGWGISGLSVISRCNKTYAQDGAPGAVTLQLSDRFCLDGKQLKLTGGTYGAVNSTYATEIESFSRIQAGSASVGNGPASFTVTTKNGLIYTYGGTQDSEIMAGNSGTIRTWALSKIADRDGNAIALVYQNDTQNGDPTNGSYRIDHVNYPTTTTGLGPYYTVQFSYGPRPPNDIPAIYAAGYLVQEVNQLNSITTKEYGSATVIKQYNLAYAQSATQGATTNRLTLTGVQECSASTCFPSTTIGYQSGSPGWVTAISGSLPAPVPGVLPGSALFADLNGDGRPDILYAATSGCTFPNCPLNVQFATASGWAAPINTNINAGTLLFPGRFLGNNQQQVVTGSSGASLLSYSVISGTFSLTPLPSGVNPIAAADIDGDGLDDLVGATGFMGCPGSCLYSTLVVMRNTTTPPGAITLSGPNTVWVAPTGQGVIVSFLGDQGGITAADFNGDGRADFLATTSDGNPNHTGTTPLTSNGAPSGVPAAFSAGPTWSFTNGLGVTRGVPPIDWNGDGCTDVLVPSSLTSAVVEISNCAGSFSPLSVTIPTNTTPPGPGGWFPADWDGDGRTDLLYVASDLSLHVLRSTGIGVGTDASVGISTSSSSGTPTTIDIDGDGLPDLVFGSAYNGSSYIPHYYIHNAAAIPPDLATSFTDGFGMYQRPTYVPLTNTTYYSKYSNATFPEVDIQQPIYVSNGFTAADGTGSTYNTVFTYYGGQTNVQGRGFEGFNAQRTYDSRNRIYTYNYDGQTFPYTGMPLTSYSTFDNTHKITYSSATPQATLLPASGGGNQTRYLPSIQQITAETYEEEDTKNFNLIARTITSYNSYDSYGNPTDVVSTTTDLDSTAPTSPFNGLSWTTEVTSTYDNDTANWCYGLPLANTMTNTVPDQTTQTRSTSYTVDGSHCRITQKVVQPGPSGTRTPLTVTTDYAYASSTCPGDLSSVTVTGSNPDASAMAGRTTSYNYAYSTTRCQLPERITNTLGQATILTYNYDFGAPLSSMDPNALTTSWTLDDYGRKTLETRPDGTSTQWVYHYCESAPCWGSPDLRFLVVQGERDAAGSQYNERNLFYDGFNRERFDASYRVLGTWTYDAVIEYDSLGRVTTQYQPFSSGSNGYKTFFYDLLNRLKEVRLYQNGTVGNGTQDRTTTYRYLGRTEIITDPLTNVTRVTDVTGRLRRVIDPSPGATTRYNYDAFGNLNQTIDAVGITSSATYNLRGFRTQMIDADAGTWNFVGDSLNELVSWTDAKTQSFSQTFDGLGRMLTRTEPEGMSVWTWGNTPSAYNIGQLASVSGYGYSESLTYDTLSRLHIRSITTDQNYQFTYDYNSIGKVGTASYPTSPMPTGTGTNYTVQYLYSYGAPYAIQDITNPSAAATIWSLTSANDYTSPLTETIGSGLGTTTITSSYQPWTDHLLSVQSGSAAASNLQNLAYHWDTDDNLSQRQDLTQILTEIFTPDPLNRLSSSTLNGLPNFSIGYDAAGDVMNRSDVGTYIYASGAHPHGVTTAGSNTYTYDANGNVATRNGLTNVWTSFNLPSLLQSSVNGTTLTSQLWYGPEHQRYKQIATELNGTETTFYIGGRLEKMTASTTGVTYWRHYVTTPSGKTILVSRNSDLSTSTNLILEDHLGSSDAIVNGLTGTLNVQESFSPFGLRRQSNWAAGVPSYWDQVAITESTRHGFTSHEHLDNVGLIHMNGRVYDPATGRFLSTDPVLGELSDSQRLNPYSYVSNRPLIATDPTGFDELANATGTKGYSMNPPGWYWEAVAFDVCDLFCGTGGTAAVNASIVSAQQTNGVSVNSGAGTNQQAASAGAQVGSGVAAAAALPAEGALEEVVVTATRIVVRNPEIAAGAIVLGLAIKFPTILPNPWNLKPDPRPILIEKTKPLENASTGESNSGSSDEATSNSTLGDPSQNDPNGEDKGDSKPRLVHNPKHHPNSRSPEPNNVGKLYENAVADRNGVQWAKDADGTLHRFAKPSNGETHWNGSTGGRDPIQQQNIPVEIRRLFGMKR